MIAAFADKQLFESMEPITAFAGFLKSRSFGDLLPIPFLSGAPEGLLIDQPTLVDIYDGHNNSPENSATEFADNCFAALQGCDSAAAPLAQQQQTQTPPPLNKAILVAKILTKSDSSAKRIILPRVAVEANLPFVVGHSMYKMKVTDVQQREWTFCLKCWANGDNPKPVYVLEQVAEYLRKYQLSTGDAFALLAAQDGKLFVEANTAEIRDAALRPTYSAFTFQKMSSFLPSPTSVQSFGPFVPDSPCKLLLPAVLQQPSAEAPCPPWALTDRVDSMRHDKGILLCQRTEGCNRPAGHQGWCCGHKGFKKRKQQPLAENEQYADKHPFKDTDHH